MYQLSKYFNSEYGEQICNYSESNFKFVSTCTRLTTIYRHSVIHSLIFIRFFNLTLCFRFCLFDIILLRAHRRNLLSINN